MNAEKSAKVIFVIIVLAIATAGVVWLSGFLFFALAKTNPIGKTDFGTWWLYWSHYKDDPAIAKRLLTAMAIAAGVIYGVIVLAVIGAMRTERKLHGDARFANDAEVARADLFGDAGIIIGKWKNRFLLFAGMQFVLLAAPTRSGKGVSTVIPNLLHWSESVVVLDVKLENFLITSKYRARYGQEVYLFNPFSITEESEGKPLHGKTHRYNPLGYISDNPRLRVTDILAIGYSLYPGEGKDSFFDDSARNLFLGLTLYLCETPTLPRTMGELLRQSSGKGRPVKDHILGFITERNYREFGDVMLNGVGEDHGAVVKAIMQIRGCEAAEADALCYEVPVAIAENVKAADIEGVEELLNKAGAEFETERRLVPLVEWDGVGLPPLSMECVDALNRFTNTSDNTLSSIMATFNVPLTLWASPIVDAATSANDFDLRDVRKKRMSIYLGIPANKLAEAKVLLNMFYTQLVSLNTNELLHSTPELKYTCLMLNDEFTAPRRIGIIDDANSYMAGYGLRLLTIIQSPGQLENPPPKGYGVESARTFITNHACQILFTPRNQRDANEYSEMLGYGTAGSRSRTSGRTGGSVSESYGEGAGQKRALMWPQELKEMSQREQIISLENTKAIKCTKITYYSEPLFVDRLKEVSPSLHKLGRKLPKKKQLERAWGSGEMAAPVPVIDFDLHEAVVQARMREAQPGDMAEGIDLHKLALDTSKIAELADEEAISDDEAEALVNDFFAALGASSDEEYGDVDDIGEADAISDEELAALDAEAAAERLPNDDLEPVELAAAEAGDGSPADDEPTAIQDAEDEPEINLVSASDEAEFDDLDEEISLDMLYDELPDIYDDAIDDDVIHPDDEVFIEDSTSERPILDLSVLDKPNDH